MRQGMDISHYQTVNWPQVDLNVVQFVICKATEGTTFIDPKFDSHVSGARSRGLPVGAYHFARPAKDSPEREAKFFVDVTRRFSGLDPLVLDIEASPVNDTDSWAVQWLTEVERLTGQTPWVYSYPAFIRAHLQYSTLARFPLWIANYSSTPQVPSPWSSYIAWQYSSNGQVSGVSGRVDMNRRYDEVSNPGTPPSAPTPIGGKCNVELPVLRKGHVSHAVGTVQVMLNARAFAGLTVDDNFGAATDAAVRGYQRHFGLRVDGVVGTDTWNKLLNP